MANSRADSNANTETDADQHNCARADADDDSKANANIIVGQPGRVGFRMQFLQFSTAALSESPRPISFLPNSSSNTSPCLISQLLLLFEVMDVQKLINYWITSAEDYIKTVEALWETKRYHHCLFFCHLVVEKALKAHVVKATGEQALPIHNLIRLARDAGLVIPLDKEADLEEINTFNVRARYSDYKLKFYKKATREYTEKWYKRSLEIFKWLKKKL